MVGGVSKRQANLRFAGVSQPAAQPEETVLPRQSNTDYRQDAKNITFIRHGKSAGNAKIWGVVEKGDMYAYRDGHLVADGKRQAVALVAGMDEMGLKRIVGADVVFVSPLARSMATAIIVLAQAHYRLGAAPSSWPRVEVMVELREKVKSDSERPGTNAEDSLSYIRRIATGLGKSLFNDPHIMDMVLDDITQSYVAERQRTAGWQPEPTNAQSYICMLEQFKERLAKRPEANVLLVGHSGWARFAFSAFMPAATGHLLNNLESGARDTCGLRNCGTVYAVFKDRMFHAVEIEGYDSSPGNPQIPIGSFGRPQSTPLISLEEAKAAHVVPEDASMERITLLKKKKRGGFEDRLFTFSAAGGVAHLAWADKWGKPRGSMTINDGKMTLKQKHRSQTLYITHSDWDSDKVMELRAHSEADFERFSQLLLEFQADRSDTVNNPACDPWQHSYTTEWTLGSDALHRFTKSHSL